MRKLKTYATSPWLIELHRRWLAARGKQLDTRTRPFARDWNKLLDDSGTRCTDDIQTAVREVEALEQLGHLKLTRHRYRRYRIERVCLPLEMEIWMHELFGTTPAEALRSKSLDHVARATILEHPDPEKWAKWCGSITAAFQDGKRLSPLHWRYPNKVEEILNLVHGLTSHNWQEGTLIRNASIAMGRDSKWLEQRRDRAEAGIASYFGRDITLESIGIIGSEIEVRIAGRLELHFPDQPSQPIARLRSAYHLTSDLDAATHITTSAIRVMMVENIKTTLRQLASANTGGETLYLACAFPTRGLRRMLELLPPELPLFHFGDTDPAGFHILAKLRAAAPRDVAPWMMHRRLKPEPEPLTDYDRKLLPRLIADPLLADVRPILREILESGDKGDYEQETLRSL